MIVTDLIKEKADVNYKIYEENINKYYNNHKRDFNTSCLKNYIYKFYIQPDYASAHNNKHDVICSIHNYIDNLYFSFYDNYKNNSTKCTVTKELIDDVLLKDNSIENSTVKYIIEKTGYNKNIEEFLKISMQSAKSLPKFALWDVNKNNVYIFLAVLIDHIVTK